MDKKTITVESMDEIDFPIKTAENSTLQINIGTNSRQNTWSDPEACKSLDESED